MLFLTLLSQSYKYIFTHANKLNRKVKIYYKWVKNSHKHPVCNYFS
ncbi:RpiR family phosphosugar-binding transcriptional regulator [Prevotella pallens ATCC 700821]|uniref:RpiR family phosphosugar-binding transcriptional regulator n=1 Tax=Prevotella pallens ATCC 700821 TaxID=997353 RepID=F9DKP8_9BACT|nr:RpiR family phosphosugar-binding transcriptional regulator [Prevotella pallens ATCC 700821]